MRLITDEIYSGCNGTETCNCRYHPFKLNEDAELEFVCPWCYVNDKEFGIQAMKLYNHYKAGFMLYEGGIDNQPLWYTESMRIIGTQIAEREQERFEAQKKSRGL